MVCLIVYSFILCIFWTGPTLALPLLDQAKEVSYEGHQLFSVTPTNENDVNFLRDLQKRDNPEMQFWSEPSAAGKSVHIMVTPAGNSALQLVLKTAKANYQIEIPNVQREIEAQKNIIRSESSDEDFNFYRYHPLDEITKWLEEMAEEYSGLLSLINIGQSHEGRPITVVKISSSREKDTNRPSIWLDAGIHANEWVTPASMLYNIHKLVSDYDVVRETTWLIDNLDWYILPVFNPDGYVFSWTNDRLWRKNRAKYNQTSLDTNKKDEVCIGVDMNRNWPYRWGEGTADKDPCGRMYIGPSAQSEPEVKAVIDFLASHSDSIEAYLAFHSFGQLWMVPPSSNGSSIPPNTDEMKMISQAVTEAIYEVHGSKFKFGSISDLVGTASGASVDYTYSVLGIPYSFGVELRDTGRYGTLLPTEQVKPAVEEAWAGIQTLGMIMVDKLYDYNYDTKW